MNRLVVFFNDRDTEGTQEGGEWSYRDRDSEGTGVNVGAWWCVPVSSSPCLSPVVCPRRFVRPRERVRVLSTVWCVPTPSVHAVRRWPPEWCVPVAPVPPLLPFGTWVPFGTWGPFGTWVPSGVSPLLEWCVRWGWWGLGE
jgi:hypothetical protein